jgi:hypothetical protein
MPRHSSSSDDDDSSTTTSDSSEETTTESSSSSSSGDDSSSEEETKSKKRTRASELLEPPPVLSMSAQQIYTELACDLLFQEAALQRVSTEVWRALQPRRPSEGDAVRVRSMVLCGASGVGKTLLCERLRALMLCAPGQRYASQSLVCHLGGLTEVGTTKFSGCSAGWDGFGARSFAQLFKQACAPVEGRAPPYVVVQLDELDKADRSVMDAVNSLLDRGFLELTAKMEQVRPAPETAVLLFFTANYAADAMRRDDTLRSVELVREAMRAHGLQDCDLGRLGTIVPFPALSADEMREVFVANRARLLAEHPCGPRAALDDEGHDALMAAVLEHYDARLGVREAMRQYARELEDMLDMLQLRLDESGVIDEQPLDSRHEYLRLDSPRIADIRAMHYGNTERLRLYDQRGQRLAQVIATRTFSITDGDIDVSVFVLPPPPCLENEERKKKAKKAKTSK